MNDFEENEVFGKLSKINSAGLTNSTINNLWVDFFRHFRDGKFLSANSDLDCIWTILGGEKGIESSSIENDYKSIETELGKNGALKDQITTNGFEKINNEEYVKFAKNKKVLLKKALFLRRLQNQQGKGTAYLDGDDEDFD